MTPTPASIAQELADRLLADGKVIIRSKDGKRLFLLTSSFMGMTDTGIMVALEGGGCHFWDGSREINAFRLISSGFDLETSATLADILNLVHFEMARETHAENDGLDRQL